MTDTPRWFSQHDRGHAHAYVERFRRLAREEFDLHGEARLVDALVGRRARILDAGCGPGRVGAELAARGHDVTGVDIDPVLIDAAVADHPDPCWMVEDLSTMALPDGPFDAIVAAGNVLVFLAPDTEAAVVTNLAAHLAPGGVLVTGFRLDGTYDLADFDKHLAEARLVLEHRYATWDMKPFSGGDYAVSVSRRPPS